MIYWKFTIRNLFFAHTYYIWNSQKYLVLLSSKWHSLHEMCQFFVKPILIHANHNPDELINIEVLCMSNLRIELLDFSCTRHMFPQSIDRFYWIVEVLRWSLAGFDHRIQFPSQIHCNRRAIQMPDHFWEPLLRWHFSVWKGKLLIHCFYIIINNSSVSTNSIMAWGDLLGIFKPYSESLLMHHCSR